MKVTIKDIAKEAEVSACAVSLVLNHKTCRISEATKERIYEIAAKYNYTVNQTARNLVTKKSHVIGLIIPDIENMFFSSLSKQIEEYCRKKGYALMIVNTNEESENDLELLNLFISRGVDGILYTPSNGNKEEYDKIKKRLRSFSIPFVMVDRYIEDVDCNKVYYDNKNGTSQAISHLVLNGHTKIGCIGAAISTFNENSRVTGYKDAMQEFHLPVEENYIYDGQYRFYGGYLAGKKIIKSDLTAVFICNDMMALGFLKALEEAGKKVPEDYSIISYDNTLNNYVISPEITTIDQDVTTLAKHSCKLLLKNINTVNKKNKESKEDIANKEDIEIEENIEGKEKEIICLKPQLLEKCSVKKLTNS